MPGMGTEMALMIEKRKEKKITGGGEKRVWCHRDQGKGCVVPAAVKKQCRYAQTKKRWPEKCAAPRKKKGMARGNERNY